MLPALFYPKGSIKRVLVLGVGGGSVIHLLRRHVGPDEIVGVELNPVHLSVAQRFFGVTGQAATLHQADAVAWLRSYRGPAFDMIIDDLFIEADGEGERAVKLDEDWFALLNRNLTPGGLLVVNVINGKTLKDSAYYHAPHIAREFAAAFQLTMGNYHNIIAAFLKQSSSGAILRRNLAQTPGLSSKKGPNKLKFSIKNISA